MGEVGGREETDKSGGDSQPRFLLSSAEWLLLMVLAAVQLTHIIDFMIIMPLGPRYFETMGLSTDQFGLIVSAYSFSASLFGLLAARFIDRFDRKTALLSLYTGFTIGTFLCAVAPGYLSLLFARILTGAFGGVAASCVLAIIGDAFPDSRRGRAMGVIMSAFSLASIAGVPAGLALANRWGLWVPFAVLGGLGVVVLVLAQLTLPSLRGHMARGSAEPVVSTWTLLVSPTYAWAHAFIVLLMLSSFALVPYLATYLEFNVGCAQNEVPYVYFCGGLATLFTLAQVGRLADRYGKLFIFRVCGLLTVVPFLLITNLPPVALTLALATTTLLMVASSSRMVPAMAMITSSAAPRYRGSFMSVNSSVQQMGIGLGSYLGGLMLTRNASGQLIGYPLAGAFGALMCIASVLVARHLRPAQGGTVAVDPIESEEDAVEGQPKLDDYPPGDLRIEPGEAIS